MVNNISKNNIIIVLIFIIIVLNIVIWFNSIKNESFNNTESFNNIEPISISFNSDPISDIYSISIQPYIWLDASNQQSIIHSNNRLSSWNNIINNIKNTQNINNNLPPIINLQIPSISINGGMYIPITQYTKNINEILFYKMTIYIVCNLNSDNTNNYSLFNIDSDNFYLNITNNSIILNNININYKNNLLSDTNFTILSCIIYNYKNCYSISLYKNNISLQIKSINDNLIQYSNLNNINIGYCRNTNFNTFPGNISEILIYNEILSTNDNKILYDNLYNKWHDKKPSLILNAFCDRNCQINKI